MTCVHLSEAKSIWPSEPSSSSSSVFKSLDKVEARRIMTRAHIAEDGLLNMWVAKDEPSFNVTSVHPFYVKDEQAQIPR